LPLRILHHRRVEARLVDERVHHVASSSSTSLSIASSIYLPTSPEQIPSAVAVQTLPPLLIATAPNVDAARQTVFRCATSTTDHDPCGDAASQSRNRRTIAKLPTPAATE